MRVLTLGVFDLFHDGHKNLLDRAKELGEVVVGVPTSEGTFLAKGKFPIESFEMRLRRVMCELRECDSIIGFFGASDEAKLLDLVNPDVICRGDDAKDKPICLEAEKRGIKIVYFKYTEGISSTLERNEICLKKSL